MNKEELTKEFIQNCYNILEGKPLINNKIWMFNPCAAGGYFTLFNSKNLFDDTLLEELVKIGKEVKGIHVRKIKDSGYRHNTIIVELKNHAH